MGHRPDWFVRKAQLGTERRPQFQAGRDVRESRGGWVGYAIVAAAVTIGVVTRGSVAVLVSTPSTDHTRDLYGNRDRVKRIDHEQSTITYWYLVECDVLVPIG